MVLRELLLTKAKVGDLVIFYDGGYQCGSTIIDCEDLFIRSLSENILNQKVQAYGYCAFCLPRYSEVVVLAVYM